MRTHKGTREPWRRLLGVILLHSTTQPPQGGFSLPLDVCSPRADTDYREDSDNGTSLQQPKARARSVGSPGY